VHDVVKKIFEGEMNLLETACRRIQESVALLSPEVKQIRVRVSKLHPPVEGILDRVFVEDEWVRGDERMG